MPLSLPRTSSLMIAPAILLMFLFRTAAYGEAPEKNVVCRDKPFANTINVKFTWVKVEGGNTFLFREADIYNVWEKRIGFGVDSVVGSGNFFEVRPYATFSNGRDPLTLIVGYDADSTGARFAEYGVLSQQNIGPLTVFPALVNFSAVSRGGGDYLEGSVIAITRLSTNHSAGVDLEEIHHWDGKADNLFAGPILISKISALSLTTRLQVERHLSSGSRGDNYIAFIGLRIPFDAFNR